MTFLQPFILWGLPLILLPILIHLFNRLRHRSLPWAAMMFLRTATRKSTRYARLRQFLILLFRVLAVLLLVLALSRPLAGGWMGWMVATAPDVILVLLDRSASMEARDTSAAQSTKREEAIKLFSQAARGFEKTSRVVLIDSAQRMPQNVPAALLGEVPTVKATDTAADVPAMIQTALDWFVQNKPGTAELWIASDLQASNWDPASDRWPAIAAGLTSLPQGVRVRLLALNREGDGNDSIAVRSVDQRRQGAQYELDLVFEIERSGTGSAAVPVTLVMNGSRSQLEVKMDGPSLRYRHRIDVGRDAISGWGYVELPADSTLADNRSYFVYGIPPTIKTALVAEDSRSLPFLQLAAAPDPGSTNLLCDLIPEARAGETTWSDYAMVIWQRPLPADATAKALQEYVSSGGVVVFFPADGPGSFAGLAWGDVQEARDEKGFAISRWDQQDGPLANTEEGLSLLVSEVKVRKRKAPLGEVNMVAAFEDGASFLARRTVGNGQVFFCSTLPHPDWSTFHEGAVLVPMVQRLINVGAARLRQGNFLEAGHHLATTAEETWAPADTAEPKDMRERSGVYRSGSRMVAVNRPAVEDGRERVEAIRVKALFGNASVRLFEDKDGRASELQSELWRLFLFLMAIFLLVEAILILPDKARPEDRTATPAARGKSAAARQEAPALSEVGK